MEWKLQDISLSDEEKVVNEFVILSQLTFIGVTSR